MPFSEMVRREQTSTFARQAIFTGRIYPLIKGEWMERAHSLELAQAVLCLGLGAEVGYFSEDLVKEYLESVAAKATASVAGGGSYLGRRRIEELLTKGFVVPSYRPRFPEGDASALAFRAALLPIVRIQRDVNPVRMFFAAAMAGNDYDALANLLPRGDGAPSLEESRAIDGTLGALSYMRVATDVLETAGDWASDRSNESDFGAWLKFELGSLFQVQIDTSNGEVKKRITRAVEHFARITARESRRIIEAEIGDSRQQTEMIAQLTLREEEWRQQVIQIVEDFDASLSVMATATSEA